VFSQNIFAAAEPSEAYVFVDHMIQVTKAIKTSADRFKPRKEPLAGVSELYLIAQTMKNFQTAVTDIEQAKSLVEEHQKSKNTAITEAADAMLLSLDLLLKNYQETIKEIEKMYSPQVARNPKEESIQSAFDRLLLNRNEIFKVCTVAASMCAQALISDKTNKKERKNYLEKGSLNYLVITSRERDVLKKELEDSFGDDVKHGLKGAPNLSFAPAVTIYDFLNNMNFIFVEEKK